MAAVTVEEVVTETVTHWVDESGRPVEPDADDEEVVGVPEVNVPEGEIPVTGAEQPPAQPAQQQPIMPAPQFEEEAPEPPTDHHPRILSSSRGPDKTVDDPALASLASKHGKLTLVRFQDEQGRGISTEVQDSMGRALSTIKDPEMMEEEVIEDEAMHELEQKYGKLTVSRFVNEHNQLISTEIWAQGKLITSGTPPVPPNAVYKAQPIDKGSMISLIFLGIATFIFLAQLGYGIFSRESSKVNGNARAKAIARKREAERTQGKAEVSEGEHIKVPKSVGKAA